MSRSREKIEFHQDGIGKVLTTRRLSVPPNQREYSWTEEHVTELIQDLAAAFKKGEYFLGTIVLSRTPSGGLEIADGQQRLATTSIIFAAMRDWMLSKKDDGRAKAIEQRLNTHDDETGEIVPRLSLNVDDNTFFRSTIILRPDDRISMEPTKPSHRLLLAAAERAKEFVDAITSQLKASDQRKEVTDWSKFITEDVQVIVLTVPDHVDAFVMFETLNDRGLKASQADLIKNFLLSQSGIRISETQKQWAHMLGVLDSTGRRDLVLTYLRHLTMCREGPTKERDLLTSVKSYVNSETRAVRFADELATNSNKYASLFNPDHPDWTEYGASGRRMVRTMLELDVEQIRPLMFAVLSHFAHQEVKRTLRLFVSWSVRFLIAGGRGGLLDRHYALRAQEVADGRISSARELAAAMQDILPQDAAFRAAFADARVSRGSLAKYYLRAMELQIKEDPEPHFIPNEDESINLEHILPVTPGEGWGHVDEETAQAYYKRIGNMVLMPSKKNMRLGNGPFKEKKMVYAKSPYVLTKQVTKELNWHPVHIVNRQKSLADIAVKTWPLFAS